jgi:thioredoxin 1
MAVRELEGSELESVRDAGDRLSLVDFSAEWCGPCKMLHPVLEKVSDEMSEQVDFYAVDVDRAQAQASKLGIRGVPTMIVFHGGSEVDRMVGFRDASSLSGRLRELVDEHLSGK